MKPHAGCGGGGSHPEFQFQVQSASAVLPSGYWAGVTRAVPITPHGNKMAVSCHNCYGDTVAQTQTEVAKALGRNFDLVEFDLTLHANGQVYVEHNDSETAHGTFAATLANTALQQSDRMLFLEIKESYSTQALSDTMMRSVLRFGVNVGGTYRYATAPLSSFDGSNSYFIVGAYDGNGAVRQWVNNVEKTPSASVSGGVVMNNSPVVIGADPQGATDRRFFFNGKVQQVMVQKWRDH